jgi:hypothetical protein
MASGMMSRGSRAISSQRLTGRVGPMFMAMFLAVMTQRHEISERRRPRPSASGA